MDKKPILQKDYNVKVISDKDLNEICNLSKSYKEKQKGIGSIRIIMKKAKTNFVEAIFKILQHHQELEKLSISLSFKTQLAFKMGMISNDLGMNAFREVYLENKCFPNLEKIAWVSENEGIVDSTFFFIMNSLELPKLKSLKLDISKSTFDHECWLIILEMLRKRRLVTKFKVYFREILLNDPPPQNFFSFLTRNGEESKIKLVKILLSDSAFCEADYQVLAQSLGTSSSGITDFSFEVFKVPSARFDKFFYIFEHTCLLEHLSLNIPQDVLDFEESEKCGVCLRSITQIVSKTPFLKSLTTNMVYLSQELGQEMKEFFLKLSSLKFLTNLSLEIECQPMDETVFTELIPSFVKTAVRLKTLTLLLLLPHQASQIQCTPIFKLLSICYPETKVTLSIRKAETENKKRKVTGGDDSGPTDRDEFEEGGLDLELLEDLFSNLLHLSNLEIHINDFYNDKETVHSLLGLLLQFTNLMSFFLYVRNIEEIILEEVYSNYLTELAIKNPLLQRLSLVLLQIDLPFVFSQPWNFFKCISLNKYLTSFGISIISDSLQMESSFNDKVIFKTFLSNLKRKVWDKKVHFLLVSSSLSRRIKHIKWRKAITSEILDSILNL